MKLRVGTSGFSFPDWVGPFYPPGVRREQMLDFYATEFDCVEVNLTYYRVPGAATMESFAKRTPPSFDFMVKAHKTVTHDRQLDAAVDEAFRRAVVPLEEAGKYRGTLAQFPWSFRDAPESRAYLASLRARLPDAPVIVEFRNRSWAHDETFQFLRDRGLGYSVVDAPPIPTLMPTVVRATSDLGYVRLHGRNMRNWWGGSSTLRYDYDYSEPELRDWREKVRALAAETTTTYVFFNNCHAGHAARNAILLKKLLAES